MIPENTQRYKVLQDTCEYEDPHETNTHHGPGSAHYLASFHLYYSQNMRGKDCHFKSQVFRWKKKNPKWGMLGKHREKRVHHCWILCSPNEITTSVSYIPNRIHQNSRRQVIVSLISWLERWVWVFTWNLITGKPLIKPRDTWQYERGNCTNRKFMTVIHSAAAIKESALSDTSWIVIKN